MFPYVILMLPYQLEDSHCRAHLVCTLKYYRPQYSPFLASTQYLAAAIFSGSCWELWQGAACQWVGWGIHALVLWSATDCVLWPSVVCPGYGSLQRWGHLLRSEFLVLDFLLSSMLRWLLFYLLPC